MKADSEREADAAGTGARETVAGRRWRWAAKGLLPFLVVGAGVFGMSTIKNSVPKVQKRPVPQEEVLVQVEPLRLSDQRVTLEAMGSVIPAIEIVLKSRVAGEVVEISPGFVEGGLLKAGQQILKIDPQDYVLDIQQKRSAVTRAQSALKLEMGHQDVAKREWELLNQGRPADPMDLELALRRPHLEKARADLAAAEADLKQAELNLARTRVVSPVNAIVRGKSVEVGSQVAVQESLAALVGADAFWVRVSVPVDRLGWIDVPRQVGEAGSRARVFYGDRQQIDGRVIKLLGDLEAEGRMARVLVEIADPLGIGAGGDRVPLLIGEYVRVEMEGRELREVYRIPRAALRDNERIWIAGADKRLEIRDVETVWRDAETVLLRDGLSPGELLVTSDIPAPVAGMALKIETRGPGAPSAPAAEPPAAPAGDGGGKG